MSMMVNSQNIRAQSSALPVLDSSLKSSIEICRRHRQSRIATRAASKCLPEPDNPKPRKFRFSLRGLLC